MPREPQRFIIDRLQKPWGTVVPAFLSHSSKDKAFVQAVASQLGPLEYELDETTFEYTLNVRAIRDALQRSDLVVFFVSADSITSTFVAEEQRQALEAMGRGTVKKVLVFAIGETTYRDLPDWLREINVAQRISSPQLCARRIQATLAEISIAEAPDLLYLGRDDDEKKLRRALRLPAGDVPTVVHIAGFHGIGRRTFLRETLRKVQPGRYTTFPIITVNQYTSADDIYRSIYRLTKFSSLREQVDAFSSFETLAETEKWEAIANAIIEISDGRELLTVYDEGNGVFSDGGELYEHWSAITGLLKHCGRPVLAFIQTRSQPARYRLSSPKSYHQRLDELDREACKEIISFSLKERDIDFTEPELDEIVTLAGGHPFNIRIAVGLSEHYQVAPFLANPNAFIGWRDRRGEEFLAEIAFAEVEAEVMAILVDYRYASAETLLGLLSYSASKIMDALQTLQDFFCIEFRDGVFNIASPIREAARRDARFTRLPEWHREMAEIVLTTIQTYTSDDEVPVSLLETATLAAVRAEAAPEYIRTLVLPSHFLMIAREHYDEGRWDKCIDLCKQAYEYRRAMTLDAQVETLRIWALSASRIPNPNEFAASTANLARVGSQLAVRTLAFVRGFSARLQGKDDEAEGFYKHAWDLSPTNGSINRELAKLYCNHKQYTDAEGYARQAYGTSPTNPYIIDIMVEVLEGKKSLGLTVDEAELRDARDRLKKYGAERGFSFHYVREAQKMLNLRKYDDAIAMADNAINNTPTLHAPYFIKIEAQLRLAGGVSAAEQTLAAVKGVVLNTGTSEGTATSIAEAEVSILIEKRQFSAAKSAAESDRRLSESHRRRLLTDLAKAVAFEPSAAPAQIQTWAKGYIR